MNIFNPKTWGLKSVPKEIPSTHEEPTEIENYSVTGLPPGRVSSPDIGITDSLFTLKGFAKNLVTPTFRVDLVPLIRDLYKINPDVGMALQDMFKLANTGHFITFPNNTDDEEREMIAHLKQASKNWSRYSAGIDGLVNRIIVQCLVGGAVSIEGVPNKDLTGLATILFIKPETIKFRRETNGVYHPYQKNPNPITQEAEPYIRLNVETYKYIGMYNDTDEPYGVPPFMPALDSLDGQHVMKDNMKNIMEKMGLFGFMEALMAKPDMQANESIRAYESRLNRTLVDLKRNINGGMKDGVVTGYIDDHEFKLNSTTHELGNIEKPWGMNEQQIANGLGVNSTIIGVETSKSEGASGIALSKLIAQLGNIQMVAKYAIEFIYSLQLRLAGYENKGMDVKFNASTISDEVKIRQAEEYKIRNVRSKYDQGIISQDDAARELGYDKPDLDEPRVPTEDSRVGVGTPDDSAAKRKREADKDKSDRKTRDKNKPTPKRADQDPRPR